MSAARTSADGPGENPGEAPGGLIDSFFPAITGPLCGRMRRVARLVMEHATGRRRRFVACAILPALAACTATAPAPRPVTSSADTIRIVGYNIHHGEGMDGVIDLERLAAVIAESDPDLVAVQEVDRETDRTGRIDQARALGRLTGLTPVFGAFMPYQGGDYGMAVLSRWPVIESHNFRLPDGAEPRSAVAVRVRVPDTGRELLFAGIHFYRTEEERLAQATHLLELIQSDTVPVILAGDFNSTPGSAVIDLLTRSFMVADKGEDHLTFPSWEPEREIDFIMVRPGDRFEVLQHSVGHEPVASDHRPLRALLVLRQ